MRDDDDLHNVFLNRSYCITGDNLMYRMHRAETILVQRTSQRYLHAVTTEFTVEFTLSAPRLITQTTLSVKTI
jgi:hypothetical protein